MGVVAAVGTVAVGHRDGVDALGAAGGDFGFGGPFLDEVDRPIDAVAFGLGRGDGAVAAWVNVAVADHAAERECARGLWIGIDELVPGRSILGVEPAGGVWTDDPVDVGLCGVDAADE